MKKETSGEILKSRDTLRKSILFIVITALFAAISYILSTFPKFNVFTAAPWMDVDFSDAPALMAAYLFHPLMGVCIVVIKSLLHMISVSTTGYIGFLANIITGGTLVLSASLIFMLFKRSGKTGVLPMVISSAIGIAVQIVAALFANFFLLLPLYVGRIDINEQFGSSLAYAAIVIFHNLLKDVLNAATAVILASQCKRFIPKSISKYF